jgi:ribosomal protein S1
VDGVVVSTVPFGTFVAVADGLQGLVHESERHEPPAPGASLRVEILAIDTRQERLSLRPV